MGPPLNELGRRLAAAQDRQVAARRVEASPSRLLADLARRRRTTRRAAAASLLAAAIAVAVAVVALRTPSLAFTIDARAGRPGAWIAADPHMELPLHFSDGSHLVLAPAARARVAEIGAEGARVVLERGALDAVIVHRERTRWQIEAGPFTVRVTGTRFRVTWQPETEQLELVLADGSVRVAGPLLDAGRTVTSGETLRVRVQERSLEIRGAPPPVLPAPAPAPEAPSSAAVPPATSTSVATPEPRAAPPPPVRSAAVPAPTEVATPASWRELALVGRYRDALDRARSEGFDALCDTESAADLLALGDAARFAGDPGRARQAYLALRRRHPGGRDAATAAFVLGRMAFDQQAAFGDAARWFGAYLAEAPGGSYARDAAGRLVEAHQRAGDAAAARAAAERYLATYPKGPHADLARSLVGR